MPSGWGATILEVVKLLIVVEQTASGFSAYSPDVPGCTATGATREEVEQLMREAVAFHLDGMREDGLSVPAPQTYGTYKGFEPDDESDQW